MKTSHFRLAFLKVIPGIRWISLLFCFLLVAQAASAQENKKDLENKKRQLQKELRYAEELLNKTKKDKKLTLNQLVTLNRKISMRQELIATINYEIRILDGQIRQNNESITKLSADLQKLKLEYSKMIMQAYRNRDAYTRLMFIFSAEDFNQAYRRLKYYQKYSEHRIRQAEEIKRTQTELSARVAQLQSRRAEKEQLLKVEEQEKSNLAVEKQEQELTVNKLQEQEKELLARIREKEEEQKKLQAAIQRIIEEEIRKSREAAKKAGGTPARPGLVLTPEAQKLGATFEASKGKLPWPVVEGLVTQHFGEQQHPVLKQVTIKNNGINITTREGAPVRSVFEGEVIGIIDLKSAGMSAVMIRHGEFVTIYSNLQDVFVKSGDKVATSQNIGRAMVDENKSEVHFEIWKGNVTMNPEPWLSRHQ